MKTTMTALCLALAILLASAGHARVEVKSEGFYVNGEYFYPVGVNYMPRDSALRMWKLFDPEAIRAEFRLLKSMDLNTARCFIYWADLNPEPGVISEKNLEQIDQLMDAAHDEGIMIVLTLYTGHMSGSNWFPRWMNKVGGGPPGVYQKETFRPPTIRGPRTVRDIYEDELTIENALLQARVVAKRYRDHPALLYWDFANEPQYWQMPRTPELGQRYVEKIVKEIKAHDPNHPVAFGMGKFLEDTGFHSYGQWGINSVEDVYLSHTYPSGYYPYGPKPVDTWISYYAGFENAVSLSQGLPLQFQEFGLSSLWFVATPPAERDLMLGGYYRCSLWGALLAGANAGSLGWMSGDYKLWLFFTDPYFPRPYELSFGVYDRQYRPKASGEELARFAGIMKEIGTAPLLTHHDPVAIILPENYQEFPEGKDRVGGEFMDTHKNHDRFMFSAWLAFRQLGINPRFALAAGDCGDARLVVEYTPGQVELECAFSPNEENLARLRERYRGLLEQAGLKPPITSSEPFVETGVLSGRYLLAINHLPKAVTTTLEFAEPTTALKCWYGSGPRTTGDSGLRLELAGFGVEVCEITRP